jgi:hypothetical protein
MPALLTALGFLLGSVATFTVVGWTVLVWIPGRNRPLALAPLVGAGAMVLWLSLVGLVVPPGSAPGAASLVAASTVGFVGALAYRRDRCTLVRGEVIRLSAAVGVGVVCVIPFLAILTRANSTALVHLSGNHDAFFFTAVPEWLTAHRAVGVTGVTADGSADGVPLLGSTWDLFANHSWRIGSESLTAAFARVFRADPVDLWLPVTLTYHVLFVVGVQLAASRLGRSGRWTYLVALAVGSCAAAIGGIIEQHTPTILGLALALGLIAELVPAAADAAEPPSTVVVALLATAVAAVYGELYVLLGIPLLVVIAIAWRRRRLVDRRWLAGLGGWCLLLGTVPWVRSVRASDEATPPEGFVSAFEPHLGPFTMAHNLAFGTWWPDLEWPDATPATRLAVASFLVALVVGLVAVVVVGRNRAWWATLVIVVAIGWSWFGHSISSGYPQQRFVEWSAPLLILGSLLGWSALVARLDLREWQRRITWGRPMWVRSAASASAAAIVLLPGIHTAVNVDDAPHRRVDESFADIATWVGERDATGANTIVFAQDYFTSLWAPYALRDLADTSFVSVYRDYYDLTSFSSMAGRRWLLLDRSALAGASAAEIAIAESNDRFALLDLHNEGAQFAVPPLHRGRWSETGETVIVTLQGGGVTCTTTTRPLTCD